MKNLIRTYKAYTIEDLRVLEKEIVKQLKGTGFKTHIKDAVNYFVIEVYTVTETAHNASKGL